MIYFAWSILNIFIYIFFLYSIYYIVFYLKKRPNFKFKGLSVIIVIVGVLSILNASNQEKDNNKILLNSESHNITELRDIILENNETFDIHFLIPLNKNGEKLITNNGNSYLSGFISGFKWKLNSFHLNENGNYYVNGNLNWTILGVQFYGENKMFKGV